MSETATGADPVSATVVIARHVRPGREQDYLRWQAEINNVCRTFSGFEAMDVVPPVPGVQDSYVIVFRFDSFAHLDAWLRSDARQAILARGEGLFTSEARPQVVARTRPAPRGAGIVVSTRVKPGRETECREWQSRIDTEAARFPGVLGNEVFAPAPGVQEEWESWCDSTRASIFRVGSCRTLGNAWSIGPPVCGTRPGSKGSAVASRDGSRPAPRRPASPPSRRSGSRP
jgi:antibiotic biosynthesis monooxygenase (ABM) superfamily enzyme